MQAPTCRSGFRTHAAARSAYGTVSTPLESVGPAALPSEPERWSFSATVADADAVFLVLETPGRASRWLEMQRAGAAGWTLTLPLSGGRQRAKIHAQRGTTMTHGGGGDLAITPPEAGGGRVEVETARLAWSA